MPLSNLTGISFRPRLAPASNGFLNRSNVAGFLAQADSIFELYRITSSRTQCLMIISWMTAEDVDRFLDYFSTLPTGKKITYLGLKLILREYAYAYLTSPQYTEGEVARLALEADLKNRVTYEYLSKTFC